jgi:hypothetical protein
MTGDLADVSLRRSVSVALDQARQVLAGPGPRGAREALAGALRDLDGYRARWDDRLRVAVAGRISTGKSTLINALLGERLAETAARELTSVVTWLRHAPERELTVYYKDTSIPPLLVRPPGPDKLAELTTHHTGPGGFKDDVDYITYNYPNERLAAFDIIDTPGLDSMLGLDSDNTMRHLGPRTDTADALILVFERAAHEDCWPVVSHFQRASETGQAAVSPLTTIGVLTMVEKNWKADESLMSGGRLAVLRQAEESADKLLCDADLRRLLYDIHPVASKIGEAASLLAEDADFAALTTLATSAALRPAALAQWISDTKKWRRDIAGVPVSRDRREDLYRKLTGCGIMLACHLIREGVTSPGELRPQLREHSGLTGLRAKLAGQFGGHADLIKLIRLIHRAEAMRRTYGPALAPQAIDPFDRAIRLITSLKESQPAFDQAGVLRAYYEKQLQFSEAEIAEMLRLFGESAAGRSLAARLGQPGAPTRQLADYAAQRDAYWRGEAAYGAYSRATSDACRVMSRTYNHLRVLLSSGTG